MTDPVKNYYEIEPAALERIYALTSGQPYFIQLLCHGLFHCWHHEGVSRIESHHVDKVLLEAVELGSAVLKYNWEELTDGEKMVVAAMAAVINEGTKGVEGNAISRLWRRNDVGAFPIGSLQEP